MHTQKLSSYTNRKQEFTEADVKVHQQIEKQESLKEMIVHAVEKEIGGTFVKTEESGSTEEGREGKKRRAEEQEGPPSKILKTGTG